MKARPLRKMRAPALAGVLNETKNLQRDHRQHARHQVQNEAADETENKEANNVTQCRILVSRCHFGANRNLPGTAIRCVSGTSENDQPGKRFEVLLRVIERNTKGVVSAFMRFQTRVTDGNIFRRRGKEVDRRKFRQLRLGNVQNQSGRIAFPGSGKIGRRRPRQLLLKAREKVCICRPS